MNLILLILFAKSSVVYTFLFFFNDTATTEIYTLSLHDALPIHGLHPLSIGVTAMARHASESLRLVDVAVERLDRRHQTLVSRLQVTRHTTVLRRLRSRHSGPRREGEQEGGSQSADGHPKTRGSFAG